MSLIDLIKEAGQDHEFYPTTNEIIARMVKDIAMRRDDRYHRHESLRTVLDVGAGDGKVLSRLKEDVGMTWLYAIEKSTILLHRLPKEVIIAGTDFEHDSLISKPVDIVFSNPPYSQFERWCAKIIREAASELIYLVIPERWSRSAEIADALEYRGVQAKRIGSFDFEDAEDRQARAKVDLLVIDLGYDRGRKDEPNSAFERAFKDQFADLFQRFEADKEAEMSDAEEAVLGGRRRPWSKLKLGAGYPAAIVGLYDSEMANIRDNYAKLSGLDVGLMRELGIGPEGIMKSLFLRLSNLKVEYWAELFRNIGTIRERLASKQRARLLETMNKHAGVEFTVDNIYAVLIWAIKNANACMDEQLCEVYEAMVDACNVVAYKSNQRTWVDNRWRYNEDREENTHFALDYRIVTQRVGGVSSSRWSHEKGLSERGAAFIGDLMTIANNLGFGIETERHEFTWDGRKEWQPGKKHEFLARDGKLLIEVRGFKNGNLHFRMRPEFMLALNVEYGRLKGWLRSGQEAAEELGDARAARYFNTHLQLPLADPGLLLQ